MYLYMSYLFLVVLSSLGVRKPRRCFRWCSRWAWDQAMWTHPRKESGPGTASEVCGSWECTVIGGEAICACTGALRNALQWAKWMLINYWNERWTAVGLMVPPFISFCQKRWPLRLVDLLETCGEQSVWISLRILIICYLLPISLTMVLPWLTLRSSGSATGCLAAHFSGFEMFGDFCGCCMVLYYPNLSKPIEDICGSSTGTQRIGDWIRKR